MKHLFATILLCLLHQITAEECDEDYCQVVKCMQVDTCPSGSYKQTSGFCNCCSYCVTYRKDGESCDGVECLPELSCNNVTKICQTEGCKDVMCKDSPICGDDGRVLKRNPEKCRCCDVCALNDDETDDDSRC